MRQSSTPTQISVPQHLLFGAFGLIFIVVVAIMGFSKQNVIYILVPLATPIVLGLFLRPDITLALALTIFNTSLNLPGLPQAFDLSRTLILIFMGAMVPAWIINKRFAPDRSWVRTMTLIYCGILIITMSIRGFGLRMLGSETWGGTEALLQYVFIFLLLFRNHIKLSPRQWNMALAGMLIGSSIPMLVDILYMLTGGATSFLFYAFAFNVSSFISGMLASEYGGVWRLQRAIIFAPCLVQLSFFLFDTGRINRMIHLGLLGLAFLLAGLSGHRVALAILPVYMMTYWALRYRQQIGKQIVLWVVGISLGFGLMFMIARYLPFPFQRAVASFGFIPVGNEARRDADGTTHWRLQVWKEAMNWAPRYLWVGRGLLLSSDELMQLRYIQGYFAYSGVKVGDIEEAIIKRDYHNGPIALLLDLGVFGLITGIGLMLVLCREGVRNVTRRTWYNRKLEAWHLVIAAQIITETVVFITLYGDVRSVMKFLLLGAIAQGLRNADTRDRIENNPAPAPAIPPEPVTYASRSQSSLRRPALHARNS